MRPKTLLFLRNLWLLRRELLAVLFRRPRRATPPVSLTCIRCRHELTKPCKHGYPRHMIRWPAEIPHPTIATGQYVEVPRMKPGVPFSTANLTGH